MSLTAPWDYRPLSVSRGLQAPKKCIAPHAGQALAFVGTIRLPQPQESDMPISLYDASVRTYLQLTKAMTRFLDKGRVHFEEQGVDPSKIVETRLYPDMLPFRFQIVSVAQHSVGALRALQEGRFKPPTTSEEDYQQLQELMARTVNELKELTPEAINASEGKELIFEFGKMELPFVAEDFILSFSLPNFFFHVTTAYDILRTSGVPLGKADFMGPIRFKK